MAGSFLSHLDLALLPDSLPALDAVVFYPCWRMRQLADGFLSMAFVWVTWNHPELKEIAVLNLSFVCG